MAKSTVSVSSADTVRAWAVEQGLAKPTRGRLSKAAIEAFDAQHPKAPYQAGFKPEPTMTVAVPAKDKNGRKRKPRQVTVPLAALRAVEGVGKRGKVSEAVAREFAIRQGL